jgi:hypothetical protein
MRLPEKVWGAGRVDTTEEPWRTEQRELCEGWGSQDCTMSWVDSVGVTRRTLPLETPSGLGTRGS